DEEGRVTVNELDENTGLRTSETIYGPAGQGQEHGERVQRTEFFYENANFPGVMTMRRVKSQDGENDLVAQYILDPATGRVVQEIVNPGGLNLTTSFTYDANGNKLSATDPKGNKTYFGYDQRNRLIGVAFPGPATKSMTYDDRGNKTSETDEN